MRDTFLFDLDGTLLPFHMDEFIKIYFTELGKFFHDIIDGRTLAKYVMASTEATIVDLEPLPNEEKFMGYFQGYVGQSRLNEYRERFDLFYEDRFDRVKQSVVKIPIIKETIDILKSKGYELVIATNPIFPIKAIHKRIEWAGLNIGDFSYITSYEQNYYCKPFIQFYEEILETIGKEPEDCYMVGNDVQEDLIAGELGIETYLITDYMINRNDEIIKSTYQGSYEDFYEFVQGLKALG